VKHGLFLLLDWPFIVKVHNREFTHNHRLVFGMILSAPWSATIKEFFSSGNGFQPGARVAGISRSQVGEKEPSWYV
jgi:hypothetical protein